MAVAANSSKKAAEDFDKIRTLIISNGFNTIGSSMSDENSPKNEAMRKIIEQDLKNSQNLATMNMNSPLFKHPLTQVKFNNNSHMPPG